VEGQSKANRLGLTTTQPVEALNGTHDDDFSELRDAFHKPLRQPSSTGGISQADHSAPNKDSDHLQNDRGRYRLLVTLTTGPRSRRYPDTLPPEMPASWWEGILLGASDDAIGSEDARLVFTHILHRLVDQKTATDALRQPSARARIATAVGGPRQRARKCSSRHRYDADPR
jgi:hypothetical protein